MQAATHGVRWRVSFGLDLTFVLFYLYGVKYIDPVTPAPFPGLSSLLFGAVRVQTFVPLAAKELGGEGEGQRIRTAGRNTLVRPRFILISLVRNPTLPFIVPCGQYLS